MVYPFGYRILKDPRSSMSLLELPIRISYFPGFVIHFPI